LILTEAAVAEDEDLFLPFRSLQPSAGAGRSGGRGCRPPKAARGLSRASIVTAAVALADAEGSGAVTMRRVARELGVGAMSLYWHVESGEQLRQLMLERVRGEAPAPEPTGDWRADLRAYARCKRAALLRHPWAIDYLGSGPPAGPNDARDAEQLLGALGKLGVPPGITVWAGMTVMTYVLGAALREVQEIRWQRSAERLGKAASAAEIDALTAGLRRAVRESGRYPHLTAVMDAGIDPDAPESRQERFEFGLDCVLAGIEARLK
jgi:AcrR family transcriptional regulator